MNAHTALARIKIILLRWVSPTSLLFQVTAGLTLTVSIGLAGIVIWSNWALHQGPIQVYEQTINTLTTSIAQSITNDYYSDQSSRDLQVFMNQWSSPITWLWLKQENQQMMAESAETDVFSPTMQSSLMSMEIPPSRMLHYSENGHHLLIKAEDVSMGAKSGQLFVVQDITSFYRQWFANTQQMIVAVFLYGCSAIWVLVALVRRSLHPLKQVNQWATEPPQSSYRYFKQLPDEVRDLVRSYHQLSKHVSVTEEHQRQFTNQISHELRTPLSLIYGYLQSLLKRSTNLTHAQREALQVATEETEHTIQILQDLLNTERIHSLIAPSHQEVLDLNLIVADVVRLANKLTHHPIQTNLEKNPVCITTDRSCLTQLLLYLLEQAVRHASLDQVINVQLKQMDDEIVVMISVMCEKSARELFIDPTQLKLSIAHSLAKKINSRVIVLPNTSSDTVLQIMLTTC